MNNEKALAVFENFNIRRAFDEKTETWYFSVVDIIAALIIKRQEILEQAEIAP